MVTIKITELKNIRKTIGLIGARQPHAVLLKTRFGIHTFGVRFPIDVVILDKEEHVMKIVKSLKPNRIFLWHPRYDTVIELPAGEIEEKRIKIGEMLKLVMNEN